MYIKGGGAILLLIVILVILLVQHNNKKKAYLYRNDNDDVNMQDISKNERNRPVVDEVEDINEYGAENFGYKNNEDEIMQSRNTVVSKASPKQADKPNDANPESSVIVEESDENYDSDELSDDGARF